jgi:hypothetical protein
MADEITISVYAKLENGYLLDDFNPGELKLDQTTADRGGKAQTLTSAEEVIDFGDVVTPGILMMRNLDDTYSITCGPESDGAMVDAISIEVGEIAGPIRVAAGAIWRARAETGTSAAEVKLDVHLWSA